MKPKIIFTFVFLTALIAGGIWLGIFLTQKNAQPVMAIQISNFQENQSPEDVFLLLNKKNKIIYVNFNNLETENIKIDKVIGIGLSEFFENYFKSKKEIIGQSEAHKLTIEIFGTNHDMSISTKRVINKCLAKSCDSVQNFSDTTFYIKNQTTNLSDKYKKFSVTDFNVPENQILLNIAKNMSTK